MANGLFFCWPVAGKQNVGLVECNESGHEQRLVFVRFRFPQADLHHGAKVTRCLR